MLRNTKAGGESTRDDLNKNYATNGSSTTILVQAKSIKDLNISRGDSIEKENTTLRLNSFRP